MSLAALVTCCTTSHDIAGLGEADAGGTPAAPSGELCTRLAAIQCDGEQQCCTASVRSRERCVSELASACEQSAYLDPIAQSRESGFDAQAADRIFGELMRRVARCDTSVLRWVGSAQGPRSIFRGSLDVDESCYPASGPTGDRAQVAVALTACRLDRGLACLPNGLLSEWRCAPKQATGQSCLTDDNCQPSDACDNFGQARLGTCVARLPQGAACDAAGQCQSAFCDDALCSEPTAEDVYCPAPE